MLKRPDLSQLSLAEKDALITALFDQLDALIQKMQGMQSRIEALEVRIPDHRDRDFRANVTGDSGRS